MRRGVALMIGCSAMALSGCATTRGMSGDWEQRFGSLESRVATIEQRQSSAEEKVWNVEYSLDKRHTASPAKQTTATIAQTDRNIQRALQTAGFYQGSIDGKIGPQTRQAIKSFQRAKGMQVDGKVGKNTWRELQKYL